VPSAGARNPLHGCQHRKSAWHGAARALLTPGFHVTQSQESALCRLHDDALGEAGGAQRAHLDAITRCRFSAGSPAASGLRAYLATASDTRCRAGGGSAAASGDAPLRVWDVERGELMAALRPAGVTVVQDVAWDASSRYLAAAMWVPRVCVWKVGSWQLLREVELPAPALAVAWQIGAPRLAVGMGSGAIEVLELD
jgi:hypothetical protein